MNLETKISHESTVIPGVTFVIRRLNQIRRAKRDLDLAAPRARVADLVAKADVIPDPDTEAMEIRRAAGNRQLNAEELARVDAILTENSKDPEKVERRNARARLFEQCDLEGKLYYKPASIRAGLMSIQGLEVDGKPATVDSLLESPNDALIDEIYDACEKAAGLSAEQSKNLQPSGTSDAPETLGGTSTTATAVAA